MKKIVKELKDKSVKELEKEAQTLREEIAKMQIEKRVKPPKDSNEMFKKRKRLAVVLTLKTQKELEIV